jgi:cell division protein FtsL
LRAGVLWILVVAALLAGIVALNVAVLGLNMEVERLDVEKEKLKAENAVLSSELSSAAAAGRIEVLATRRLGLVDPIETTYVQLAAKSGR